MVVAAQRKSGTSTPPAPATLIRRLSPRQRETVEAAAWECTTVIRYFAERDRSVITVLQHGAKPAWWKHHPARDAHDPNRGVGYYYHSHPTLPSVATEHGHFHFFLQAAAPLTSAHVVALSVDPRGLPIRACTTNRWVTGETMQPAEPLIRTLYGLTFDTGRARRNVDWWLSSTLRLFLPQIEWLLRERDRRIAALADAESALENRDIQTWSHCKLSMAEQVAALGS